MNIDIATSDLQALRDEAYARVLDLRAMRAGGTDFVSYNHNYTRILRLRKFIRKLNRALKQVHGHDCNGQYYLDN